MNQLFENIGPRLKSIAKSLFIIEIISAIFVGLGLMIMKEGFFYGVLVIIAGIISAWIFALILYGLGELIEKTDANTVAISKILKNCDQANPTNYSTYTTRKAEMIVQSEPSHRWLCSKCNKMRTQTPCEFCGEK